MINALRLVFGQRRYAVAAFSLCPIVVIFYAWAAQVFTIDRHGISTLFEPDVMVAIVTLASLLAIALPLQFYAFRLHIAGASETSSNVLGFLLGTASMSCCAPVLLPGVLSLIGVSGATILSINVTVHRYFVPLAALSALLLGYSVISTASSLDQGCCIVPLGSKASLDSK